MGNSLTDHQDCIPGRNVIGCNLTSQFTGCEEETPLFRFDGDTAIVAGGETVVRDWMIPNAGKTEHRRF